MDEGVETSALAYPATYQAPLWDRIKPTLIMVPIFIFTIEGRVHQSPASSRWVWIVIVIAFFALMASTLSLGFCKVTLYRDRIEKRSFFGTKIMRRGDVGKIVKRQRGLTMLTYKYNSADGMMLPKNIGGDEAWNAWMDYSKKL